LYVPGQSLSEKSLVSKPIFHPKYCFVRCSSEYDFWMIGSANLTAAAISPNGTNIEVCSIEARTGPDQLRYRKSHRKMIGALNPHLRLADGALISRYANIRSTFLKKNRIILDQVEESAGISKSREFFIEVGAGCGMDRHQVEFNRELASFFMPPTTQRV